MSTMVIKRSVVINGRKTSISVEDAFYEGLKVAAIMQDKTLGELVGEIAREAKGYTNLSSACRLYVLDAEKKRVGMTNGQEARP